MGINSSDSFNDIAITGCNRHGKNVPVIPTFV